MAGICSGDISMLVRYKPDVCPFVVLLVFLRMSRKSMVAIAGLAAESPRHHCLRRLFYDSVERRRTCLRIIFCIFNIFINYTYGTTRCFTVFMTSKVY